MIAFVEAVAGHELCAVELPEEGWPGRVLRCSHDLAQPGFGREAIAAVTPSPDGTMLAVRQGGTLGWVDVATMAFHALAAWDRGALGVPVWSPARRVVSLAADPERAAGERIVDASADLLAPTWGSQRLDARVDRTPAGEPVAAWAPTRLAFAGGDGVYVVDVPALQVPAAGGPLGASAPPRRIWEPGSPVDQLVWAGDGALWGAADGELVRIGPEAIGRANAGAGTAANPGGQGSGEDRLGGATGGDPPPGQDSARPGPAGGSLAASPRPAGPTPIAVDVRALDVGAGVAWATRAGVWRAALDGTDAVLIDPNPGDLPLWAGDALWTWRGAGDAWTICAPTARGVDGAPIGAASGIAGSGNTPVITDQRGAARWGPTRGACWDARSPPGRWGDRVVWLALDAGRVVVRDQTGVLVRLPGDVARIW